MPTPVITALINQVGMIVAGDELEEGLWDNIRAKRARGEKMRPKGAKGVTDDQIKRHRKTKKNKIEISKIEKELNLRNTTKV